MKRIPHTMTVPIDAASPLTPTLAAVGQSAAPVAGIRKRKPSPKIHSVGLNLLKLEQMKIF